MKKHTKSFMTLACGAAALAAAGFGFSAWSSDIALDGNISAAGRWDVKIADASISALSSSAAVEAAQRVNEPAYEVVLYDIYADYAGHFDHSLKEYRVHIDDKNPRTVSLTEAEFNEYTYETYIYGNVISGYDYYTSFKRGTNIRYMINLNEEGEALGFTDVSGAAPSDDDSRDGTYIGTAMARLIAVPKRNTFGIVETYNQAKAFYKDNPVTIDYPAGISEDGQSAVFGDVLFSLPGQWAEYSVSVSNEGTAAAYLKDWDISLEVPDSQTVIDAPNLDKDVLEPGETCTFTFVVSVDDSSDNTLDTRNTAAVHLKYEQEETEPAPASDHHH